MAKCWAKLDKTTGSLDTDLNIFFDENKTGAERSVTIKISSPDGSIVKKYVIAQKAGEKPVFKNDRKSAFFTKEGCDPETQIGETLEYVVEAGTYSSSISLDDANNKALEDIRLNGQKWVNLKGDCITTLWKSAEKRATVRKNDCNPDTEEGSEVTMVVEAGRFTSTISQADADKQAQDYLDANKQQYANANGVCRTVKWYNDEQRGMFERTDCLVTESSTRVEYIIEAGRFSSSISKDDANSKAEAALMEEGQAYADENAECVTKLWYNSEKTCTKTKNNCEPGFIGGEYTYIVEEGKYTSDIDQADADAKADADIEANCQDQANLNGECLPDPNWFIGKASARVQKSDCDAISQDGSFVDLTEEDLDGHPFISTSSQEEADAMAEAAMDEQKQALANMKGTCIDKPKYYGVFSMSFDKQDCIDGGIGSSVLVSQDNPAITGGPFLSYISQEAANSLAEAAVREQGQSIANAEGTCLWTGAYSKSFQKNDCEEGFTGSFVTVSEKDVIGYPSSVQSTVSLADANNKAQSAVESEGQGIANVNGNCTDVIVYTGNYSKAFTPECPSCESGVEIIVTAEMVNGSPVTSTISQEDADAKAMSIVEEGGQNYANKNGQCEPMSTAAVFEDVIPEELRCVDGKSEKKQHDVNECSPTFGEERWIEGGSKVCQWIGKAEADIQKVDCENGEGAGSFVHVTEADMEGLEGSSYPYISFVSQEDADAKAALDVNGQLGQQVANAKGTCSSSGYYEQRFYKNDCGSCLEDTIGFMVTSDMTSGYPFYDEDPQAAYEAAKAAVEAEGQAICNKNAPDDNCQPVNLEAVWVDSDPLELRCNNGVSQYKQINTNPCYGGEQERWVNGGDKVCSWTAPDSSIQYTKTCADGGVGGTAIVNSSELSGYPFISFVSEEDAIQMRDNAFASQGESIASSKPEYACTWTGVASKSFTRNNCGSCQHGVPFVVNQDHVGGPFVSNISQADANAKAMEAVNANGQNYVNKNTNCEADSTSATWSDTGSTQCSGCTSQKQQRDTNSCSSTYNQTRWVNGGGRDCSRQGSYSDSWGSCNGCTQTGTRTYDCGGTESISRSCVSWEYYGTGDCVGHTRYSAYKNTCTGEVDNQYEVDCHDCCNCGSYGSWSDTGSCGTGGNSDKVKYVRYDDCGRADYKYEPKDGRCGYVACSLSVDKTSVSFGATSGLVETKNISVTSKGGSDVKATTDSSWIFIVSPIGGSGENRTVSITAESNPDYSSRTGSVTISNACGSKTITVTQHPKPDIVVFNCLTGCSYADGSGLGSGSAPILALIDSKRNGSMIGFSISTSPSNMFDSMASNPSGQNYAVAGIVTANTSNSSRTGTITLTQNETGQKINIPVKQAGKAQPCNCSLAGTVDMYEQSSSTVRIEYMLDLIPIGDCGTNMSNYDVSFDLNTGEHKTLSFRNDTTSNTGEFTLPYQGMYRNVELSVTTQCSGEKVVNITKH